MSEYGVLVLWYDGFIDGVRVLVPEYERISDGVRGY